MADYRQRYEDSNDKMASFLAGLLERRSAAKKSLQAQIDAERLKAKQATERAAYEEGTNVQKDALTGAALGSSIMPGWGTLAGAVGGAALGTVGAFKEERKKHGTAKALWNTFKNVSNPLNVMGDLRDAISSPGGVEKAAGVAGGLVSAYRGAHPAKGIASKLGSKINYGGAASALAGAIDQNRSEDMQDWLPMTEKRPSISVEMEPRSMSTDLLRPTGQNVGYDPYSVLGISPRRKGM